MKTIIRSELSAQGINKKPNPMVLKTISLLQYHMSDNSLGIVVDQGCGQLRHVNLLLTVSKKLILVDTDYQLSVCHDFNGQQLTIREFVHEHWPNKNISVLSSNEFSRVQIRANTIFSINVLDVTTSDVRNEIAKAAKRNLAPQGHYVLIIPRNDAWTLRICKPTNRYSDGYTFPHSRGYTYYRNWSDGAILTWVHKQGFDIVQNLSNYRQVALICKRDH